MCLWNICEYISNDSVLVKNLPLTFTGHVSLLSFLYPLLTENVVENLWGWRQCHVDNYSTYLTLNSWSSSCSIGCAICCITGANMLRWTYFVKQSQFYVHLLVIITWVYIYSYEDFTANYWKRMHDKLY